MRGLPIKNILARPFRSVGLVIVVAVLAFSVVSGSVLVQSLENGASSVERRLGADIMLVPVGSAYAAEALLVQGEPSTFYMEKSIVDTVSGVRGVGLITTQFYLGTVSDADCCDFPVQLIAFDPGTDFTVQPWIGESYADDIKRGELVVGSSVYVSEKGTVKIFNTEHPVAARLSRSGTGLDTSIFMTLETMGDIVADARMNGHPLTAFDNVDTHVSVVLIKVAEGFNVDTLVWNVRGSGVSVDIVQSTNVTAGLTQQMGSLVGYIKVFEVMLWALAVVVLGVLFSVSINERKKEFATLRIMGATRKKLLQLVLAEASVISIIGATLGALSALLFVVPFSDSIGSSIGLPYITPSLSVIMMFLLLSITASFVVGPVTAIWTARRIGRSETHSQFTEGN